MSKIKLNTEQGIYSQAIAPHPALQDYIVMYLYNEIITDDAFVAVELFPTGTTSLVITLSETPYMFNITDDILHKDRFCFVGQLSKYRLMQLKNITGISIVFKPYAVFSLFGVPQHLATDLNIEAEAIFPDFKKIISQLEDHFNYPEKCIEILDCYFLKKLQNKALAIDLRMVFASQSIMESAGKWPIDKLCKHLCLTPRTLELLFKEKIGLSPKLFSRIMRFNNTLQQIIQSQKPDWQTICFQNNYFDQNHFIRDFKYFFGTTPSKFNDNSHSLSHLIAEKMNIEYF